MVSNSYYVTFGVQYTGDLTNGEIHPLGVTHHNYVVIEAPDFAMAQRMADAIFQGSYSMIYDEDDFIRGGIRDRWHSRNDAEAFRVCWSDQKIDTPLGGETPVHSRSYEMGWQDGMQEGMNA
jgi:hypothetical protein